MLKQIDDITTFSINMMDIVHVIIVLLRLRHISDILIDKWYNSNTLTCKLQHQ